MYSLKIKSKNYDHFGNPTRLDFAVTAIDGIDWIENLLNSSEGINDFRKLTIDLVIAPYHVNIKQYDYDTAYSKIAEWLDKCGRKRSLDFNLRDKLCPKKIIESKNKTYEIGNHEEELS
jgi:hypothetical protein